MLLPRPVVIDQITRVLTVHPICSVGAAPMWQDYGGENDRGAAAIHLFRPGESGGCASALRAS